MEEMPASVNEPFLYYPQTLANKLNIAHKKEGEVRQNKQRIVQKHT